MTARRIGLTIAAAVGVVAAVGAFLLWPRGTTEITEEQAVEDFRDAGGARTSTTAHADGPSTPVPGVYTYRATGQEDVKLGPLPAETRTFPATVTAVVVDAAGGCFDLTVNLFAQHTEDTRYCTDGTFRIDGHTKHQQIGALSPTATVACDPKTLLPAGTEPGGDDRSSAEPLPLTCSLELSGGPASIAATLTGTATARPVEEVDVAGTVVRATPIEVEIEVTGDLTGTWTETTWWSSRHLPLRIERDLSLAGPATFTERSQLELTDLEPTS